jgi:hypothetical protein
MNEVIMSHITIGFVPRDRFCKAAESLALLYENTEIPFDLIVVDCNIPEPFRQQMEGVLKGRSNASIIHTDHYLLTHQAHNLILKENQAEFLCLIENDILVEKSWLSSLVTACGEHPADVAVPLIIEQQEDFRGVHFDDRLGYIQTTETPNGVIREIVPRSVSKEYDLSSERRSIGMLETHCVLYRSNVFDRIGPFDETMSARAEVDVSLALDQAKVPIVFEPKARVIYSPPPPIYPEERDYYFFKWDIDRAVQNHERLEEKWHLVHLPSSVDFVKRRRELASEVNPEIQQRQEIEYRAILDKAAMEIAAVIPAGDTFILVDEVQWKANEVAKGRHALPFLERDGQYWGSPPDDETAVRELERLHAAGATFIVFAEPAFWWLDFYKELHNYLHTTYHCVLKSERMVVFDLG